MAFDRKHRRAHQPDPRHGGDRSQVSPADSHRLGKRVPIRGRPMRFSRLYIKIFLSFVAVLLVAEVLIFGLFMAAVGHPPQGSPLPVHRGQGLSSADRRGAAPRSRPCPSGRKGRGTGALSPGLRPHPGGPHLDHRGRREGRDPLVSLGDVPKVPDQGLRLEEGIPGGSAAASAFTPAPEAPRGSTSTLPVGTRGPGSPGRCTSFSRGTGLPTPRGGLCPGVSQ